MENSKVIHYLSLLDKHALNRLERFLISPCNHIYPNVVSLFRTLSACHPEFNKDDIEKEKIYKKAFGQKQYNQQELANNMKYLCEGIEDFLVTDQIRKKPRLKAQLLTERLRQTTRKLHKDALVKYESSCNTGEGEDSAEHFFHTYNLHQEQDIYFSLSGAREENPQIQLKNNALDHWFAHQKLKTWCEMLNRQNIVSASYEYTFKEELSEYIKTKGKELFRHPAVEIYYNIYLTLTEPEEESHYKNLVKLLDLNESVISKAELRSMYDFAQNYCIKKLNSGNTQYANEIFSLYEELLRKKILLSDDDKLSPWDYKNIVTVSLRLKKDKWCREFISKYRNFLPRPEMENAYRYNLAYYCASVENFKEARKLLQRVEFSDVFYQLGSKSILLRCYYELSDEEAFLSHCDSFKKYLERNKQISEYQRTVNLNLIAWTRKTFRIMMRRMENKKNVSKKEIENLKSRINGVKQINNLAWLLEKVDEIV